MAASMSETERAEPTQSEGKARRFSWLGIVLSAAALVLGGYVALQVVGVLYGIVAPPMPPVPPDARERLHENRAYGVDTWRYNTTLEACRVVAFYQENGAQCQLAPLQCAQGTRFQEVFPVDNTVVARCYGELNFSIFRMGWSAFVVRPAELPDSSEIELRREVYWTDDPTS